MSSAQILAELPNLKAEERKQVFERLCQFAEKDLLIGVGPTPREWRLLDAELADFERDGNPGTPWREALRRILASSDS
ncbi:MAG TPA: hypothetical protein VFC78_19890 [Tepidisphaeraceae bacterium]|nr:hypothetical protein [Tepidisphaeraceae bacterium]